MSNRNKDFVKEPGFGLSGIVILILAAVLIFGALGYFLIYHGEAVALPRPPH